MALKYKVKNTTILHNKKLYAEGSSISLEEEDAQRLEDFVELIPNQTTSTKSVTKNATKTETKTEVKTETSVVESENGDENDK